VLVFMMSVLFLLLLLLGAAALYRCLFTSSSSSTVFRAFAAVVPFRHRVRLDDGRFIEGPDRTLGAGAFGDVRQYQLEGRAVAVKIPQKLEFNELQQRELELLQKVSPHPHVLEYIQQTRVDGNLWVVLGLMKGTVHDVLTKNSRLSWRTKLSMALQIVAGLVHLHFFNQGDDTWLKKAIVHQDLKPENLLVDRLGDDPNIRVRIGDFGLARQVDQVNLPVVNKLFSKKHQGNIGGTMLYTAPEVVKAMIFGSDHCHPKLDVFSLGIILWEIAIGYQPSRTPEEIVEGRFAMFERDKKASQLPSAQSSFFSKLTTKKPVPTYPRASIFGSTINKCTKVNPGKRASAKDAEKMLKEISVS
jgi:serine/threonine protein kinase